MFWGGQRCLILIGGAGSFQGWTVWFEKKSSMLDRTLTTPIMYINKIPFIMMMSSTIAASKKYEGIVFNNNIINDTNDTNDPDQTPMSETIQNFEEYATK